MLVDVKCFGIWLNMNETRSIPHFGLACIPLLPRAAIATLATREMSKRSSEALQERVYYLQYAKKTGAIAAPPTHELGPVWQYWHSGYDKAPKIIQQCFDSVAKWTHGRERILITDETLADYVNLPQCFIDKRENMGATHFSDILRVNLLKDHGGTWVDASVFMSGAVNELTSLPYFSFSRNNDPFLLSSWFMHSSRGHIIPDALAGMLAAYWENQEILRDYFAFHYLFEVAVTTNSKFRSAWLNTPVKWADTPHWLQLNFYRKPDRDALREAMTNTSVHKLSYKFDAPTLAVLTDCLNSIITDNTSP